MDRRLFALLLPLCGCDFMESPPRSLAMLEPALGLTVSAGTSRNEEARHFAHATLAWPLDGDGGCDLAEPPQATLNGRPMERSRWRTEGLDYCELAFTVEITPETPFPAELFGEADEAIDVIEITDGTATVRAEVRELLAVRTALLLEPADGVITEGDDVRIVWTHPTDVFPEPPRIVLSDGAERAVQQNVERTPDGFIFPARFGGMGPATLEIEALYSPVLLGCAGVHTCEALGFGMPMIPVTRLP